MNTFQRLALVLGLAIIVLAVALIGVLAVRANRSAIPLAAPTEALSQTASADRVTPTVVATDRPISTATSIPTPAPTETPFSEGPFPIGYSVLQRPIMAYRFGRGPIDRALIGGIHGGYEWNTVELMTRTLEYLKTNPNVIPPDLTLYVVPVANPDGLAAGTDRVNGRLNANLVDLNRNWDYQWQMTATHGTNPISAGTAPFSEPETQAMRDFIVGYGIHDVIFYHSALAKVFPGVGITQSKTVELAKLMAEATGYRYAPEGVPGQITTGDAIDWLTVNGITAIEVELTTHEDIDWEQNLRGLIAFLNWDLPASDNPHTYTVEDGDTLSGIAERFGVTMDALMQANPGIDPDFLSIGQVIVIP